MNFNAFQANTYCLDMANWLPQQKSFRRAPWSKINTQIHQSTQSFSSDFNRSAEIKRKTNTCSTPGFLQTNQFVIFL